jgi:hypothetical protein
MPPNMRIDQSQEIIIGVTGVRGPAYGHCGDGVKTTGNIQREFDLARRDPRTEGYAVESAILQHLDQHGSCTLEELARMLAGFTLNQVLFGVDRFSRDGRIILRHPSRFDYLVSAMECHTHDQSRLRRE